MKMPTLKVNPHNKTIEAAAGAPLLEVLTDNGVLLNARCGGKGTCGRCAVTINGRAALACLEKVSGSAEIFVPELSRLEEIYSESRPRLEPRPEYPGAPAVEKIFLDAKNLPRDYSAVWEKISAAISEKIPALSVVAPLEILREIAQCRDFSSCGLTFSLMRQPCGALETIALERGDTSGRNFAVAVDIGTTTVAACLINLSSGAVEDAVVTYNRQIARGEDVITRIIMAEAPQGLETLNRMIIETINDLVGTLVRACGIDISDVSAVCVAGNTAMTHILYKINPSGLRREPFAPAVAFPPTMKARRLGLHFDEKTPLISAPCVSSYIGGDITAGLLSTGILSCEKPRLLADIGTNGELVLGNKEFLVCAACSAGPAFEGVGVKCGMHAVDGAIEKAAFSDGKISFSTIGASRPKGVCGSGLLDLLCELLKEGAMDQSGKFDKDFPGVRNYDDASGAGLEFVVVPAGETSSGQDIVITETDVSNLIRSKGAVFMGITALLAETGFSVGDIEKIYIAGGFGNSLSLEKAVIIGMLPDVELSKYEFIGNSSIVGAARILVSDAARRAVDAAARRMTYVDLGANAHFMNDYTASLFLPHTDIKLFPTAEKFLAARRRGGRRTGK